MNLYRVCAVNDVSLGSIKRFDVSHDGKTTTLAVLRDEFGQWHAVADRCTHGDVSLSEGHVEGCLVECWGHGAVFDVNTGVGTLPVTTPVQVFRLRVDAGIVLVELE